MKKKKSKTEPDDSAERFGITNAEMEKLRKALDGADFSENAHPDPIIEVIGRKVFKNTYNETP